MCRGRENIHMSIICIQRHSTGRAAWSSDIRGRGTGYSGEIMKDSVRLSSSYGVNYRRLWRPCKASVSICVGKGPKCSSISTTWQCQPAIEIALVFFRSSVCWQKLTKIVTDLGINWIYKQKKYGQQINLKVLSCIGSGPVVVLVKETAVAPNFAGIV